MNVFINIFMNSYIFEIKNVEDYDEKKHVLKLMLR